MGDEGDEGRQVLVHRAEAVRGPCAHARAACDLGACLEEGDRWIVVDGFGVHGSHDAESVCDGGGVGQEFTEPRAGSAVLRETELGGSDREPGL